MSDTAHILCHALCGRLSVSRQYIHQSSCRAFELQCVAAIRSCKASLWTFDDTDIDCLLHYRSADWAHNATDRNAVLPFLHLLHDSFVQHKW